MYGNSRRVFVYCRVSTEEQGTDDHRSLDYQEEKARLRVQEKNWPLIKVRKDVSSGKSTKDRPGFQELVRDIKQGSIDVVIVYKLDRLSRNVGNIYDFIDLTQEHNVDLVSLTENLDTTSPIGRAMLGVMAVLAQLTREMIAENVKAGLEQRAKKGKWPTGPAPFGYDYDKTRKRLVVNAEEAEVVRDIFRYYKNESLGIRKIARRLNAQGRRTKRGSQFAHNSVWWILGNPVYKGVIRYNDDFEVDGEHEAIIDEELFDEVHRKLTAKQKVHPRRRYSQLLLAGIAKCATCGKPLRTHYKSKDSKSYECMGNTLVGEGACPGFRKVDHRVDNAVLGKVMEIARGEVIQNMAADELDEMLQDDLGLLRDELGKVQSELEGIGQTFNRWADRLDRGLITEEQFAARNEKLMGKQARLESRRDQVLEKLRAGERADVEFEKVREALSKFPALWEEATLEERKELMGLLIEKLVVAPTKVTVKVRFLEESTIRIKFGR